MSKKGHLFIFGIVFISIISVGCGTTAKKISNSSSSNSIKKDTVEENKSNDKNNVIINDTQNYKGNTNGNLNNFGLADEENGWIYYLHEDNGNGQIYKKKLDGSLNTKISDDYGFYINVLGDYIYYNNADDNNHIYRVKIDGTGREKLSDDVVQYIYGENRFLYYLNMEDGKIYRFDINTKEKVKLTDDIVESSGFILDKDYIYYGYKGVCRINKDGSEKKAIIQDENFMYNVVDIEEQWIYYFNDMGLFKMKKDGSEEIQLHDGMVAWVNALDDKIYFSDVNSGCVFKVSKDGREKSKVLEEVGYKINIVDNLMYYDYSNRPMKLKWLDIKSK